MKSDLEATQPLSMTRVSIIEQSLEAVRRSDASGMDGLFAETYEEFQRMASRVLGQYPHLDRWTETDDVWQTSALRLQRAIEVQVPESPLHFYRLAALQIRRTIIDMIRKLNGPMGLAANHDTNANVHVLQKSNARDLDAANDTNDPIRLADWTEFHEQIAKLPPRYRETFDLLWYNGLSQADAAKLLQVDVRTVKRRWRAARLLLQDRRDGERPGT